MANSTILRLNITLRQPTEAEYESGEYRSVGFVADALASIGEGGTVISTVPRYDSDGHDLAIIEWAVGGDEDRAYIEAELEADDRVVSYR